MTINSDNNIYAIGSASHVQLLIADNGKSLLPPIFIKKDIGNFPLLQILFFSNFNLLGIRSLNFKNNILSIGTGQGTVLFYDLRSLQFLNNENKEQLRLQSTSGWIVSSLDIKL